MARMAFEDVQVINTSSKSSTTTQLMGYLSQRIDEIAVVTSWDSTKVLYLDRRGETRILNFNLLSQMFLTSQSDTEPAYRLRLRVLPKFTDSVIGAPQHSHETRSQYLLTISFQHHKEARELIQIQHSVLVVRQMNNYNIRADSSITPNLSNN